MNDYIKNQLISVDEVMDMFDLEKKEVETIFYNIHMRMKKLDLMFLHDYVPRHRFFEYFDLDDPLNKKKKAGKQ